MGTAQEPPPDLVSRIAAREAATEAERSRYLYRQFVRIRDFDRKGQASGEYTETREVVFMPSGAREEKLSGPPRNNLKSLILTEEDYSDIRSIQPMLLTPENLRRYETRFRGEETVDGVDCWVVEVKPRQVFQGYRMFQGMLWAEKGDLAVVRVEGTAVPPVYAGGRENLFPRFTTVRKKVDGKYWFPALTWADDVLPFKSGPQRMKLEIRYEDYKRFGAEMKITFEPEKE
jgi:hypothetical protein